MHKTKSSLKLLTFIFLVLAVAFTALLGRLWFSPISIGFLSPYLQRVLVFDRKDIRLEFDDTVLALEGVGNRPGPSPAIRIRLLNVRVYNGGGEEILSVPSGGIGLSIKAMLHGIIAASSVELAGPSLQIEWEGGELFGNAGRGAESINELPAAIDKFSATLLPFFARQLLSPPDYTTPAGYLHRVRIVNADLLLHEKRTGSFWRFPGAQLDLARNNQGLSLQVKGDLEIQAEKQDASRDTDPARIIVSGNYDDQRRETALKIQFNHLNPAQLAGNSEILKPLRAVDMLTGGVLYVALGGDYRLVNAGFDIDAGPGNLVLPKIYPAPVRFDQIKAKGEYSQELKQFSLESLSLMFGQTEFEGEGLVYAGDQGPGIRLYGNLTNIKLVELKNYWPSSLADGAYRWVTKNITAGTATTGTIQLAITPDMWSEDSLPPDALNFSFNFDGVEAHYLRPMPPIQGGRGYATLTTRTLDLTVTQGRVAGLDMAESYLRFDNIGIKGASRATTDIHLTGSLPKALALIDSQPLGYPSKYGLKPDNTSGTSDIQARLKFPLSKSLTLKDVDFDVRANLGQVAIPNLFEDIALYNGQLLMQVDRSGISADGHIALNDVPFAFEWTEHFGENIQYPTTYTLSGSIEGEQWHALGLPLAPYVKGPALTRLTLHGHGSNIHDGQGTLDLTASTLSFSPLHWKKPSGHRAGLAFRVAKRGGDLVLKDMLYRDAEISAGGSLTFGPGNSFKEAIISHFRHGDTDLSATLTRDAAGKYLAFATGDSLDIRPIAEKMTEGKYGDSDIHMPAFAINARFNRVVALNGIDFSGISAIGSFGNNRWQYALLKGQMEGGKSFRYDLKPTDTGRRLDITSDDAGSLALGFGLFPNAKGGRLIIAAEFTGEGKNKFLKGSVKVKDFKIVQVPVLANILTVGSLTGISDLLEGDGINFDRLDIPFTFQNGEVKLSRSRAYGPAIGLTMQGNVDLRYDSLDLTGTIVPAYTLNSILKMVPVVGDLLMGGKGEGLFALTYQISGPVSDPKIDVNPLAALAPGFLRGIVETFEDTNKVNPERAAAEKKAKENKTNDTDSPDAPKGAEKEEKKLQPENPGVPVPAPAVDQAPLPLPAPGTDEPAQDEPVPPPPAVGPKP